MSRKRALTSTTVFALVLLFLGGPARAMTLRVCGVAGAGGECEARAYAPFEWIAQAAPRHGDPARAPAVLELGVHGVVHGPGGPLAKAHVSLHRALRGEHRATQGFPSRSYPHRSSEVHSAGGAFRLEVPEAGVYYVRAQAPGLAPAELGPFELDPMIGMQGLVLELGPGGSIEGRVTLPGGESPAGRVVSISRADGFLQSVVIGKEGEYRFDRLTPGDWLVELRPGGCSMPGPGGPPWIALPLLGSYERAVELPWSCVVRAGEVTRYDFEHRSTQLTGRLLIDGKPARGWLARVHTSPDHLVAVDDAGHFELFLHRPGEHLLRLSRGYGDDTLLEQRLVLPVGASTWELRLETGTLEGAVGPQSAAARWVHASQELDGGTFLTSAQILGRRYRIDGVPSGAVRVTTTSAKGAPLSTTEARARARVSVTLDLP